jgi:hypothetical protein
MRAFLPICLLLLLTGCEDTMRSEAPPLATIDAFEDRDLLSLTRNAWEAVASGPGVNATVDVLPGGYGASSSYLSVTGFRSEAASNADLAGVRVDLAQSPGMTDRNRTDVYLDARGYQGLSFALRGQPGTYIVQLGSAEVTDGNFYNAYVSAGNSWTEFRIPFADFQQEGFGASRPWSGEFLSHFAVYANTTGAVSFDLDDVRFY